MTYKKTKPTPVQIMTPEVDAPGFLHSTIAGKAIVEVIGGVFLTVSPHHLKSRSHEEYIRRLENAA